MLHWKEEIGNVSEEEGPSLTPESRTRPTQEILGPDWFRPDRDTCQGWTQPDFGGHVHGRRGRGLGAEPQKILGFLVNFTGFSANFYQKCWACAHAQLALFWVVGMCSHAQNTAWVHIYYTFLTPSSLDSSFRKRSFLFLQLYTSPFRFPVVFFFLLTSISPITCKQWSVKVK